MTELNKPEVTPPQKAAPKPDETPKQSKDEKPDETPKQSKDEKLEAAINTSFSRSYPASRDIEVVELHNITASLYVAEVAYTPTGGERQNTEVLAFVDGEKCFIFGSR